MSNGKSFWSVIMDRAELDAYFAESAKSDARFARAQKAFYEAQSVISLSGHAHGAWLCNDAETYCLARSYMALQGA